MSNAASQNEAPKSAAPRRRRNGSRWQSIVETFAIVAIAGATVWKALPSRPVALAQVSQKPQARARDAAPLPTQPIPLSGAQIRGDSKARVALIEFTDFQCPYCGQFSRETFPAVDQQYVQTGKLLVALRNFPIGGHPFAQKAAEAAECSGKQGKFWEMHGALFSKQDALDPVNLRMQAKSLNLDSGAFESCLSSGQTAELVAKDFSIGRALGVTGTPTFFLGLVQSDGTVKVASRLFGTQTMNQISSAIDSLLATR